MAEASLQAGCLTYFVLFVDTGETASVACINEKRGCLYQANTLRRPAYPYRQAAVCYRKYLE